MKDIINILHEAEQKFPINSWKWNGYHIWPIICGIIHNAQLDFPRGNTETAQEYIRQEQVKNNQSSKISRLWNALIRTSKIFCEYGQYLIKNNNAAIRLKKSDTIFLTDGVSRTLIDGQYHENFFAYFIERNREQGKQSLVFDPGNGAKHYPTKETTYFLSVTRFFHYALARLKLKIKPQPVWKEYDELLDFLHNKLGGAYKERLKIERLLEDLYQIDGWRSFWNKVIKKTGASEAYIIAYYNIMGWGLSLASYDQNIPSIELQHGVISDGVVMYNAWHYRPDIHYKSVPQNFYVWSEFEKDILLKTGFGQSNHTINITGHPWVLLWQKSQTLKEKFQSQREMLENLTKNSEYNILIAHQPVEDWQSSFTPLFPLIQENKDWNFWFRKHPVSNHGETAGLDKFYELSAENLILDTIDDIPLPILFDYIDIVITPESSLAIEASFFDIKTIFLLEKAEQSKKFLVESRQAAIITEQKQIEEQIREWKRH